MMRPLLWLLLTSVVPATGPAVVRAELPPLDPISQQQRVRQLLTRLDRANRVVLDPNEVVRERSNYVYLLRRMAQGKRTSPAQIEELLRRTDAREKLAIERLARRFRVQVYQAYRRRRGVFTRRRAAWNRVLGQWEAAGSRFDEQGLLVDWLERAIRTSTPGSLGPMPADPAFAPAADSPEMYASAEPAAPVRQSSSAALPRVPSVSWAQRQAGIVHFATPSQPRIDTHNTLPNLILPRAAANRRNIAGHIAVSAARPAPTVSRQAPNLSMGAQQAAPAVAQVARTPAVDTEPPLGTSGYRAAVGTSSAVLALAQPPSAVPLVDRVAPPTSVAVRRAIHPPGDDTRLQPRRSAARLSGDLISGPQRTDADREVVVEVVESPSIPPPVLPHGRSARPPEERQPESHHLLPPIDQPLELAWTLPPGRPLQPALKQPSERPADRISRRPPERPMEPPFGLAAESPQQSPPERLAQQTLGVQVNGVQVNGVQVNVAELRAQIAGNNLAIRALEADLDQDRPWTAGKLQPLVDRLGRLITRSRDLALVRDLLAGGQQAAVDRLDSHGSAISQSAARIFEARTFARSGEFPGTEARRRTELSRLDRLSRTLAELAGR